MTVRSKRSTQEGTGVSHPERRRALLGTPPHGAATRGESWELVTEVTPRPDLLLTISLVGAMFCGEGGAALVGFSGALLHASLAAPPHAGVGS
ncbi:MAG TPA: hypothetical protein VF516_25255, partial [Kofleriaceae bacterium]